MYMATNDFNEDQLSGNSSLQSQSSLGNYSGSADSPQYMHGAMRVDTGQSMLNQHSHGGESCQRLVYYHYPSGMDIHASTSNRYTPSLARNARIAKEHKFIRCFLFSRQAIETTAVILSFGITIFIDIGNLIAQHEGGENIFDPGDDNESPYLLYSVIVNVYGIFLLVVTAIVSKMFGSKLAARHFCAAVLYLIVTIVYFIIVVAQGVTAVLFFLEIMKSTMKSQQSTDKGLLNIFSETITTNGTTGV
eukprot:CFRG5012T1